MVAVLLRCSVLFIIYLHIYIYSIKTLYMYFHDMKYTVVGTKFSTSFPLQTSHGYYKTTCVENFVNSVQISVFCLLFNFRHLFFFFFWL